MRCVGVSSFLTLSFDLYNLQGPFSPDLCNRRNPSRAPYGVLTANAAMGSVAALNIEP